MAETIEEKIVSYADCLVDEDRTIPLEEALDKYKEYFGEDSPQVERLKRLHKEIEELRA